MTASHSSSVMLKIIRSRTIPALLTTTSIRPKWSTAVSTIRAPPAIVVTESALAAASPARALDLAHDLLGGGRGRRRCRRRRRRDR